MRNGSDGLALEVGIDSRDDSSERPGRERVEPRAHLILPWSMRELCQASLRVCALNSCSCKHTGIIAICIYIVKNIWFARLRMRLVEVGDATSTVVPLKQPSSTRSLVFTISGSTGNLFWKQRRTQLQTRMQLRERKVGDAKGRVKLSMFMSNSSID